MLWASWLGKDFTFLGLDAYIFLLFIPAIGLNSSRWLFNPATGYYTIHIMMIFHSFVHPSIHPSMRSFTHPSMRSFTQSFIRSFIQVTVQFIVRLICQQVRRKLGFHCAVISLSMAVRSAGMQECWLATPRQGQQARKL